MVWLVLFMCMVLVLCSCWWYSVCVLVGLKMYMVCVVLLWCNWCYFGCCG